MWQQFDQDANVEFSYTYQEMIVELWVQSLLLNPMCLAEQGFKTRVSSFHFILVNECEWQNSIHMLIYLWHIMMIIIESSGME